MRKYMKAAALGAAILMSQGAAHAAEQGCSDVVYADAVTDNFPEIADACRAVVERNGMYYTEVVARIGKKDTLDRVRLQLRMSDDSLGPIHHVKGGDNLSVKTNSGDTISWNELAPYQDISVYIPSDRWAFVSVEEPEEVVEIAIVEVEEEPALPKTASNIHYAGIAGAIALLLAMFMFMRRRKEE